MLIVRTVYIIVNPFDTATFIPNCVVYPFVFYVV